VGVCHAFNLIDGVNGFSALVGISASLALATISHQQGLIDHRDTLIILSVSIAGFLVFNFPFGRIFLGDAGAYLIGYISIWTAISILWMAPQVSPFAVLLIFFWPVADTFLAIVRRLMYGTSVSKPDRLHFHQLVMRTLQITFLGRNQRRLANPLTTIIMLPFAMCPIISGVLLSLDNIKAAIAVIVYFLLFGSTYYVNRLVVLKLRGVIKV
jgi:UDP-N-acetylmuramyl pentapeptide phosphotransferase/UDP-N-acetylglucosamine-1-phosphate transferase